MPPPFYSSVKMGGNCSCCLLMGPEETHAADNKRLTAIGSVFYGMPLRPGTYRPEHQQEPAEFKIMWPGTPYEDTNDLFLDRPPLLVAVVPIVERWPSYIYSALYDKPYQAVAAPTSSNVEEQPTIRFTAPDRQIWWGPSQEPPVSTMPDGNRGQAQKRSRLLL